MNPKRIKKGWIEATLGDIAFWGSGGTPKRGEVKYYGGDIPWIKTGDLNNGIIEKSSENITELGLKKSSAKLFPKGSVAIAMYGATIGKTAIFGIDASTNQACGVGQPLGGISSNFLHYFLKSQKQNFIDKGKGGAQPNISQTVIKAHSIELPPLQEQHRIVQKLDALLAKVKTAHERLDKIPAILNSFRQSVLAQAVSGKLTADWEREKLEKFDIENLCEKNHWNPKQLQKFKSILDEHKLDKSISLPLNWIKTLPGIICKKIVDGTHKTPTYLTDGIPFLSAKNIREWKINYEGCKYISKEEHEVLSQRCKPEKGSLLITKSGTIGRMYILDYEPDFSLFESVAVLTPLNNSISMEFVAFTIDNYLNSGGGKTHIKGTAVKHLHLNELRILPIHLPPIEEQKEIVKRVKSLFALADRIEARYQAAHEKVSTLPQSILAKAFRGELVPQDPNDEPASILLERIAALKAEQATTKKKKGKKK